MAWTVLTSRTIPFTQGAQVGHQHSPHLEWSGTLAETDHSYTSLSSTVRDTHTGSQGQTTVTHLMDRQMHSWGQTTVKLPSNGQTVWALLRSDQLHFRFKGGQIHSWGQTIVTLPSLGQADKLMGVRPQLCFHF